MGRIIEEQGIDSQLGGRHVYLLYNVQTASRPRLKNPES
jgi:hypothetical protein